MKRKRTHILNWHMGFLSKKQRYANGFKWGRREHYFEELTTKFLVVGIIGLALSIYIQFWEGYNAKWFFIVCECLLVITWIFRLISAFAHRREKAYMDDVRFHRSKFKK